MEARDETTTDEVKAAAEALVPKFQLERTLNQGETFLLDETRDPFEHYSNNDKDQAGRRISLYGSIDGKPALLLVERAPFPTDPSYLSALPGSLAHVANLGANDIYNWFLASSGSGGSSSGGSKPTPAEAAALADLKLTLIYPCTETHIKKYSKQSVRLVTETPAIYAAHVRPYMQRQREQGRLNWVYNIIEGRTEVEDVIYRTPLGEAGDEGFLLLPDLNWDRKTVEVLRLLAIAERRDIWSLRDLRRKHLPWLRSMKEKLLAAATGAYPAVEADQLKLYVHYQPTYYHIHIHIVHVQFEAGATQAIGKAVGLDSIMAMLECMAGDDEAGMDSVTLSYTLGEASGLWTEVWAPLKTASTAPR